MINFNLRANINNVWHYRAGVRYIASQCGAPRGSPAGIAPRDFKSNANWIMSIIVHEAISLQLI